MIKFIKDQNDELATVIKLENVISGNNVTGDILVLELRWEEQNWLTTRPIHIELRNSKLKDMCWKDRAQGEWVEASASFRIIG